MNLEKHTIYEIPPHDKEILMLVDIEGESEEYLWVVGEFTDYGFWCSLDYLGQKYKIIEWYELPTREKIEEDYSYHQMELEEFWREKEDDY